ncbi:SulP family inorganic anion transporter [Conexibacter woesei]|uniref:SulP family inorganic anion transporter n=1 Tax=Conexibacter woesei TaxID=191495 RepID=UPI0004204E3B|nr:SulP family inorganic anion transporter [Conexibacter woesei]
MATAAASVTPRRRLLPPWMTSYERSWLRPDVIAGLVIWSVVTPQAVAYAQIAGLPPQAGLMAAPGAMAAYALFGTSRQLVVSATTATSALSAATVGPLAHGDVAAFAALSAMLAIVVGVVLVAGGALRLGAVADLVSKPVMTGFLFGLGLTIIISQLTSLLGIPGGDGNFFPRLRDLVDHLGDVHTTTLAVGAGSLAVLVVGRRVAPKVPATLVLLALAIALSALLHLDDHGVDVVGDIPNALPDPAVPSVSAHDITALIAPALGVLVLSAEAVGVARQLAMKHDYQVDANRDLMAMGAGNVVAGFCSGFVQSGGASQTAAADGAGGRSQFATVVCAGLLLLTGAFLAPLFEHLPQATLAAIVIVAVSSFLDVAELRRIAGIRRSAIVFALLGLTGVLVLGVLQGLVVTAGLSLVYVIQRLARPSVGVLGRHVQSGAWGRVDRIQGLQVDPKVLVMRSDGPLLYPNADAVRAAVYDAAIAADPRPEVVVVGLATSTTLDVQSADALSDLARQLAREGIALRLAEVRRPAAAVLERAGTAALAPLFQTLDAAVHPPEVTSDHPAP